MPTQSQARRGASLLRTLPAALALPALLPATALAQFTVPDSFSTEVSELDPSNNDVNATAWAECTGDSTVDAAMLQGLRLTLAVNPGYTEASLLVPGHFIDITGCSRSNDRLDRELIVVGPDGLQSVHWNDTLGAFEKTDLLAAPAAHAAWVGAKKVRAGDMDGDGDQDLVGVASDGTSLIGAIWDGAAFQPVPAAQFSASVSGTVLDMALFDSAADQSCDVGVLTTSGFYVFDNTGTQVGTTVVVPSPRGSLARIQRSTGGDHLAWLREKPNATWVLHTIDAQAQVFAQTLNVNAFQPRQLTSGDFYGNGRSDLVLANRTGTTVRVMRQAAVGTFSLNSSELRDVVIDEPPINPSSSPNVLCDLDNDGDLDVLYPVADRASIFIGRNDLVDHRDEAPHILRSLPRPDVEQVWITGDYDAPKVLHVRISAPATVDGSISPLGAAYTAPLGATHLDARIWTSRQLGSTTFVTDSAEADSELIPLSLYREVTPENISFLQADLDYMVGAQLLDDVQYLCLRYVRVESGAIVESWPHTSRYVIHHSNDAALSYVGAFFFSGPYSQGYNHEDPWGVTIGVGVNGQYSITSGTIPGDDGNDGTQSGGGGGIGCITDYPPVEPPSDDPADPKTEAPAEPDKD